MVSAPDRTDGNSSLTLEITVSPGGVECRFHRLGLSCVDSLRLFAGEDIVRATAGVGSRLPLDRTIHDPEVGVKLDGRIPASAVCPWGVHPADVASERTMGNHRWDRRAPAKDICDPPSASMTAHERGMVYPVPNPIRLA